MQFTSSQPNLHSGNRRSFLPGRGNPRRLKATPNPSIPQKSSVSGVVEYYGYRYYHPELGRWISRDPIGEKGGLNLYGAFKNSSIAKKDVLGLREGRPLFEHQKCVVVVDIGHVTTTLDDPAFVPETCRYGAVGCLSHTDELNDKFINFGNGIPGFPKMVEEKGGGDRVGPDLIPKIDPFSPLDGPPLPPEQDGGNGKYPSNKEGFVQLLKDAEARAIEAAKALCGPTACCRNPEVKFHCTKSADLGDARDLLEKFGLKHWCDKNFSVKCEK